MLCSKSNTVAEPRLNYDDLLPFDLIGIVEKKSTFWYSNRRLAIKGNQLVIFKKDTMNPIRLVSLQGAMLTNPQGRVFALKGAWMNKSDSWYLRLPSNAETWMWISALSKAIIGSPLRIRIPLYSDHPLDTPPPSASHDIRLKARQMLEAIELKKDEHKKYESNDLDKRLALNIEGLIRPACPQCEVGYGEGTRRPRLLSCHDTFCEDCLSKRLDENNVISCPLCQKDTSVPEDGVQGLPINYGLQGLDLVSINDLKEMGTARALDRVGAICPQCLEEYMEYRIPWALACGHTICYSCVEEHVNKHEIIECPSCRVVTDMNSVHKSGINKCLQRTVESIIAAKRNIFVPIMFSSPQENTEPPIMSVATPPSPPVGIIEAAMPRKLSRPKASVGKPPAKRSNVRVPPKATFKRSTSSSSNNKFSKAKPSPSLTNERSKSAPVGSASPKTRCNTPTELTNPSNANNESLDERYPTSDTKESTSNSMDSNHPISPTEPIQHIKYSPLREILMS